MRALSGGLGVGLAILALTAAPGWSQVPGMINYQGRVVVAGTNFDGTGHFKFALVDEGVDIARPATAVAHLTAQFVTSVEVTDSGAGYVTAPAVTFAGGGGSGAVAHSEIAGGVVSTVVVDQAGSGYTSAPTVSIEAPQASIVYATYWSNSGSGVPGGEPTFGVDLPVSHGLYAVALGDASLPHMAPIPAAVFQHSDVRLRVWFNDGVHGYQRLEPDQRIGAVGYAMMAGSASLTQGAPTSLDTHVDGTGAWGLAVAGDYAYVANHADGLRVYNVADPTHVVNIGHTNDGAYAWNVVVAGRYAYLANASGGLRIYDIANPARPTNIGYIDSGGSAYDVAVDGDYLYLANYGDGLRVYDVSDPTDPVSIGHDAGGSFIGVEVVGNHAYLANFAGGLAVYDISDPTSPAKVGTVSAGGQSERLVVAGNYAYMACHTNGLWIFDVSDPYNPTNVGHVSNGGSDYDVAVAGNYAYLANDSGLSRVYDVSDPTAPVAVGDITDGGGARGVTIQGGILYLANDNGGLRTHALNALKAPATDAGALKAAQIDCEGRINAPSLNLSGGLNVSGGAVVHGGFGEIRLTPRTGAPPSPSRGDIYFDGSLGKLRCWDGSTWQDLW